MGKFKVGDKVRFVRDNSDGGADYGAQGALAKIHSIDNDYITIEPVGWDCYLDYPGAPAEDLEPAPLFAVGDKVRVKIGGHRAASGHGADAGEEFIIERVDEDGVDTEAWYFFNDEIEPVAVADSNGNTLRIREGRYYRTRDGRKVGPATVSEYKSTVLPWNVPHDGGFHGYATDGKSCLTDTHDIIAEWTDEPAATPSPTTGFTVPLEAPEFGGAESKFKVGDRVEIIDVGSCPERYLGTQFTIDNDEDDFDGEQAWSGKDHNSPYRFKESQLRLVAEATTAQEPPTSIADIVRRLERLEAKQPYVPEFAVGDKVTLSATVTGMNKRRVNVVIDGVPQPGGSLAVPPAALNAA